MWNVEIKIEVDVSGALVKPHGVTDTTAEMTVAKQPHSRTRILHVEDSRFGLMFPNGA